MNRLGTVIGFTFLNKVRAKSFVITTVILALLVSIGLNVPYFIEKFTGEDSESVAKIGLVYGNQPEIAESLKVYTDKQSNNKYSFVEYQVADEAVLKQDIKDKKIDGYLDFSQDTNGAFPEVSFTSNKESMDVSLQTSLQAALQSVKTQYITKGSLTAEQVAEINMPVQIATFKALPDAASGENGESASGSKSIAIINYVIVYVLIFLFFFSNMMTGNMIAAEVTAEKSSRVMEILITSVSPLTQMFGKIVGMFLIGILQIAIFAAVVVVNVSLPHNAPLLADFDLDLSQINLQVVILGFIFYILGYFLYATLFAAIGSLVSRTEDLGQAIMPITMLSLATFYIGIFSLSAPNSMLLKVCTYIPFISPVSMLVRIGLGEIATWEIALSLAILVISIVLFGWLSAKIYRTGVLLYGKRPSFKELRKAMKAYKI
ncbi:ABC transporter permease [Paenibacillus anaericanus]|uniref:ABC transporter permease n=1 Tax=Paenibacillus anaericanus TaxID=170367 RepID=A0A3S1DT44_9BACL|nr:ABC transporter permease [Paenibacillus anaericanus]RUT48478.1 ABC transporter permease [Paenibacillus anaericanus]